MTMAVTSMERPTPIFTMSCYSDYVILVVPDRNLLLHVKLDGFREWDESIGTRKPGQKAISFTNSNPVLVVSSRPSAIDFETR